MRSLVLCVENKLIETMGIAREQGLGLELQAFYHPDVLDDPTQAVAKHVAALTGFSGTLSMHGPFGDLVPGSFDPKVRQVARERILQFINIAVQFGASDLVLHNGYTPNTTPVDRWIPRAAAFWRDILQAVPAGMRVHLENLLERTTFVLSDMIDRVGDPRLGLCMDVGHVHAFSSDTPMTWVATLGASITYVHLHDNLGDRDAHLALGQGSAPLRATLALLEERAPEAVWAIEGPVMPSLAWLHANGFSR